MLNHSPSEDHDSPSKVAWANGARVPVVEAGEDNFLDQLRAEFGCSEPAAIEMWQFFEEHLPRRQSEAVLDAAAVEVVRAEAVAAVLAWVKRWMHNLVAYQDKQRNYGPHIRMSTRALALALKWFTVADAATPTDLARKLNLPRMFGQSGKATTHKCVKHFQCDLELDPMPGQRTPEACQKMAAARRKQLVNQDYEQEQD